MQLREKKTLPERKIRRNFLLVSGNFMLLLSLLFLVIMGGVVVWLLFFKSKTAGQYFVPKESVSVSEYAPSPPSLKRIGLVSGHSGFDSGAVCPNGLKEAEVNQAIAASVQKELVTEGYRIDMFQEFDSRLKGYKALALVSIHSDSCNIPGASGFKIAGLSSSAAPTDEDRLVDCLYQSYENITGLSRHPASVTDDMTNYHAFHDIDPATAGAIIETGFLLDDAGIIVDRPELAAKGIAGGIICFAEGKSD